MRRAEGLVGQIIHRYKVVAYGKETKGKGTGGAESSRKDIYGALTMNQECQSSQFPSMKALLHPHPTDGQTDPGAHPLLFAHSQVFQCRPFTLSCPLQIMGVSLGHTHTQKHSILPFPRGSQTCGQETQTLL